jgi:hypothetical protein
MSRLISTLLCGGLLMASPVAAQELSHYRSVTIAPSKTSIYVGSVSLSTPPFTRRDDLYTTTYSAKVFPYFFYSEKGQMWIKVSDDDLRKLEKGETITFEGKATNEKGHLRGISGRAVPADAHSGKLKVRVFLTDSTELIFNTTYRFAEK